MLRVSTVVLAVGLFVTSVSLGMAQNGILLVEARSGDTPVSGVVILVDGHEVVTDETGIARIELPLGRHFVSILAEGFLPLETELTIDANQETRLLAELLPQPEIEEEIIVRASRTNRRLEDQPVRIEVVDREDIYRLL